ncbi:MAG: hypothetical protein HFJ65_07890 [Eggerthellaceae bacterium]|nr:hypothetical protein [Eggerthellaceae bacterium]
MRKGMAKTGRLLCACLLVAGMSFVALPAFADDGNTEGNTEETAAKAASVNGVDYDTLPDAVHAAKAGDTITMLADEDLTGAGTLNIEGMTLDLAGHTISAKNFTLIFTGSNATIKDGSFNSLGGAYGLFYGDNPSSTNVLLEDLNITGGINIFDASVTLKDDTVDAAAADSPYYAVWADVNSRITIESGSYKSNGAAVLGLTTAHEGAPESVMNVEGGDYFTDSSPMVLTGKDRYTPTITGGTFPSADEVSKYIPDDYLIQSEGDGRFIAKAKETDQAADHPSDQSTDRSSEQPASSAGSQEEQDATSSQASVTENATARSSTTNAAPIHVAQAPQTTQTDASPAPASAKEPLEPTPIEVKSREHTGNEAAVASEQNAALGDSSGIIIALGIVAAAFAVGGIACLLVFRKRRAKA